MRPVPGVVRPLLRVEPRIARVGAAGLLMLALLNGACARPMAPPGGEADELAPAVVSITPAPMATVPPGKQPVVIEFDERISEREIEDAIYVSPATGSADIGKGRRDLEVRIAGGWQPNRVYRVVVRPTVRDLFGNTIPRPIEVVFSTGAEFHSGALAGVVYDRVTAQPVRDARVEARPADGGAYHLALTDTAGIFRMPLVPPGVYVLRAYVDQNRDRRRDEYELGDSVMVELGADTLLRPLAIMRSDTSAVNLTRVQVVDSVTLRFSFDDYMDVSAPQANARLAVLSLPDSTPLPLAGVWYPHALTAERARQDSIRADSLAGAEAAADSTAPARPPIARPAAPTDTIRPGAADTLAADTLPPDALVERVRAARLGPARDAPLPTRELMIVLEQPLVPQAEYAAQASGILNLAGIGGGGGSLTFRVPVPPPPRETQPTLETTPGETPLADPAESPDDAAAPSERVTEPAPLAEDPEPTP